MKPRKSVPLVFYALAVVAGLSATHFTRPARAQETTIAALAKDTHFHGLAVDANNASRLYLATHHGLYVVNLDGTARRISRTTDDFMGFQVHPTNRSIMFASGHPRRGGNLGFIKSTDGGRSWTKLSDGLGGPVDFHQMDVSKANPDVVYGVFRGLQVSKDGGRSWQPAAPAPQGLIGLAASSQHVDTIYAATQTGLFRSTDGGRKWGVATLFKRPTTMVHVTRSGVVYAFVVGIGLIRAPEKFLQWQVVSDQFEDGYLLHFAAHPGDRLQLFAVTISPRTRLPAVIASKDGGKTWARLGGR